MNIALCDDDKRFCEVFANQVKSVMVEEDSLFLFSGGNELINSCGKNYKYDVTLLDIEMPGMDGLETAGAIRALSPNAPIVIVTNYPKYALDAIKKRPLDYLIKPVDTNELKDLLDEIRDIAIPREILIPLNSGYHSLTYGSIYMVEVYGRTVHFHTKDEIYKVRGQLKDFSSELEEQGFFRVFRSIYINPKYIIRVDSQNRKVVLKNGCKVDIAKDRLSDFLNFYVGRLCHAGSFGD